MTMTKHTKSVKVFGDILEIEWNGNVWVSPHNGQQHSHAADAMRAELVAYFRSCGEDTDDEATAEQIDACIDEME